MELERKRALLTRACYYLFFALIIYVSLRYLWPLLLPFLLGFAVAYTLRPATNFICRHSKISRRGASIACAIVFYAVIFIICWILGAVLFLQLEEIGEALPLVYAEKIEPALGILSDKAFTLTGKFFPGQSPDGLYKTISDTLGNFFISASSWGMSLVTSLAKSIPMGILTLIFTIMSSVLICADYNEVTGFVMRQIPQRLHKSVLDVRDFLAKSLLKIIKTYLILMAITFIILALGLWILKIENFVFYAALIAFLDLLPVLGSGMILIPWGAFMIVMGKSFTGMGMLLLWVVITILRELLEPRILGGQIGLHPLITVTSMYFGLKASGVGGLILAPVFCLLIRYLHDSGLIKLYNK